MWELIVTDLNKTMRVIKRPKHCVSGLEKSSILPVLDRFLILKTDLFLDKKLKIGP